MQTQISFEILSSSIAAIAAFFAYKEFSKSKNLNAIDKFITYRDKLKKDDSLCKIIRHVQMWQNDETIRNQIPQEITLFDFYNFLGFYEEINILITKKHLDIELAKDMFAFYALQIADNSFYWEHFNEDYLTDNEWLNFRRFITKMR
jgi:hypothetical protein